MENDTIGSGFLIAVDLGARDEDGVGALGKMRVMRENVLIGTGKGCQCRGISIHVGFRIEEATGQGIQKRRGDESAMENLFKAGEIGMLMLGREQGAVEAASVIDLEDAAVDGTHLAMGLDELERGSEAEELAEQRLVDALVSGQEVVKLGTREPKLSVLLLSEEAGDSEVIEDRNHGRLHRRDEETLDQAMIGRHRGSSNALEDVGKINPARREERRERRCNGLGENRTLIIHRSNGQRHDCKHNQPEPNSGCEYRTTGAISCLLYTSPSPRD